MCHNQIGERKFSEKSCVISSSLFKIVILREYIEGGKNMQLFQSMESCPQNSAINHNDELLIQEGYGQPHSYTSATTLGNYKMFNREKRTFCSIY